MQIQTVTAAQQATPSLVTTLLYGRYQVGQVPFWVKVAGSASHVNSVAIGTLPVHDTDWVSPQGELGRRFDRQLQAYLRDARNGFDLQLWEHHDSANQRAAMAFLRTIPCGQTRSYSQQSQFVRRRRGNRFGPRNAGSANHGNHYPLVIPCHRVVRKSGAPGGFMGSSVKAALALKLALLEHEQAS